MYLPELVALVALVAPLVALVALLVVLVALLVALVAPLVALLLLVAVVRWVIVFHVEHPYIFLKSAVFLDSMKMGIKEILMIMMTVLELLEHQ